VIYVIGKEINMINENDIRASVNTLASDVQWPIMFGVEQEVYSKLYNGTNVPQLNPIESLVNKWEHENG
jgi:hypothetical protein